MVIYGSEAWTINKEIRNKIDGFEVWIYRRILKISWKDKVNNRELLRRMGEGMYLMNSRAKRKAAFFGHICRGSRGDDFASI